MINSSKKLSVTSVLHTDSGIITAFFNEMPGLVVQGDSDEDVRGQLKDVLDGYVKRLQSINDFDIHTQTL